MDYKYKILQQCEGYKIVEFQHSFYNKLKKDLRKQSNKYYNILNPAYNKRDMFTKIPVEYNQENVKSAMVLEDTIENEAIGFILDETDNNAVFDKVATIISNTKNDYCALRISGTNIIICPDEIHSVNKLKNITSKEFIKYSSNKLITKDNFSISELSSQELDFIRNKIKDLAVELLENDRKVPEYFMNLLQANLCKVVVNRKRLNDIKQLFDLMELENFVLDNIIYFDKMQKSIVNNCVSKVISGELSLVPRKQIIINDTKENNMLPVKDEKQQFNYKSIEEVIKNKKELLQQESKSFEFDNNLSKDNISNSIIK